MISDTLSVLQSDFRSSPVALSATALLSVRSSASAALVFLPH